MDAFQRRLVSRSGYPRHGAIAQASRESGVAQSLLSRYLAKEHPLKPKPAQLQRLADYLRAPYDELLREVYGSQGTAPPSRPITPHDRLITATEVIAAAIAELRLAALELASSNGASQRSNNSRKNRSSTNFTADNVYQAASTKAPYLTIVRSNRTETPRVGDTVPEAVA